MASIQIPIKGQIGLETTAKGVEELIRSDPEAEEIILEVDSLGGAVFEGFSIYNLLKNSGKKIIANIVGSAASITTLIVAAAEVKDITMNEVGVFLIHNPMVDLQGDADKLDAAKKNLEQIEEIMVSVYAPRLKKKPEEVKELMKAETSYKPSDAKKAGLVGKVVEKIGLKAVALFDPEALNKKDKNKLEQIWDELMAIKEKMFAPDIKAALNLTLVDGGSIYIDTEAAAPAVGDNVFTNAEMTEAIPGGDYNISDGSLVVVGDEGAITEIKEPNEEEMKKELEAKIKALELEMTETAKKVTAANEIKTKYEALKKTVETTAPPPSVDYSMMRHEGDGHFMDDMVGSFKRKINNA